MVLRRGFPSGRTRSPRRKTSWGGGLSTTVGGQTISATGKTAAAFSAVQVADGNTVVRTRGELLLTLLTSSVQAGGYVGAFGIAIVTAQAVSIGVTAIPGPIADVGWEGWLYHRMFSCLSGGIINQGAAADEDQVNSVSAALRLEVDSKAMRKINSDMGIVAVLEVTELGAATMVFSFDSRVLVKLA